jgi:isopentenyl diphosphate isomerase/L-lactate dehydrogenase-like FMN-dependent dehydrogenase
MDQSEVAEKGNCHFCPECLGFGCIAELPGMGGIRQNKNFQLNCAAWDRLPADGNTPLPLVRLAPITGAVENAGYYEERQFYHDLIQGVSEGGAALSIGDGCPDEKLRYGIEAVTAAGKKAAVFIKPYENTKILDRMEWASGIAEIFGVDIDSYNIVTMRNLVQLERKTPKMLRELKAASAKTARPFAIKGIFTKADIETLKEVKPDIAVVSNHGGRVENREGSTADFLAENYRELKSYVGEVWVDGGIRKLRDLQAAANLGASQVLIGRPFITALLSGGITGVAGYAKEKVEGRR